MSDRPQKGRGGAYHKCRRNSIAVKCPDINPKSGETRWAPSVLVHAECALLGHTVLTKGGEDEEKKLSFEP